MPFTKLLHIVLSIGLYPNGNSTRQHDASLKPLTGAFVPEIVKDLFSNHASRYAVFRPGYPLALYDFILKQTQGREIAWDCACGNGQVAKDLSPHFKQIRATDVSQKQLDSGFKAPNITYSLSPAEVSPFGDNTFDLITVGQALHWFRIPEFFKEARRVGKPGSTIATWGYGLFRVNPAIDLPVDDFYTNVVGPYCDPERKLIDEHYKHIDFPFERIPSPDFDFSFMWTLEQAKGYLTTWSSVQEFIKERGYNPVDDLVARIAPLWTAGEKKVAFPLFALVGRI